MSSAGLCSKIQKAEIKILSEFHSFLENTGINQCSGSFRFQQNSVLALIGLSPHYFLVGNQGLILAFRGCPHPLTYDSLPSSSKSAMTVESLCRMSLTIAIRRGYPLLIAHVIKMDLLRQLSIIFLFQFPYPQSHLQSPF